MIIGISGKKQSGKNTIAKIINQLTNNNYEEKCFADKLKNIVCMLINCTREQLEDETFKNTELGEEWDIWEVCYMDYTGDFYTNYFTSENEANDLFNSVSNQSYSATVTKIKITPRILMQLLGTKCGRDIIHPQIWINSTFADYKPYIKDYPNLIKSNGKNLIEGNHYSMGKAVLPNWIITDVRFPNELEAVKNKGGITIRVNRNNPKNDSTYEYKNFNTNHSSETALDNATFDYVINNNSSITNLNAQVREILVKENIIGFLRE